MELAGLPKLPLFVSNEQLIYLRVPSEQAAAYEHVGEGTSGCPIVGSFRVVAGKPAFCFMVPHFEGVTGKSMPINHNDCVKVAVHQQGELMNNGDFIIKPGASLDNMVESAFHRREIMSEQHHDCDQWQWDVCAEFVREHLPGLSMNDVEICYRCLYTNTADNHFVVGDHPSDQSVIIATGFHGEGFKFAPSIGDIVAAFVCHESVDPVVAACFTPHRFFLRGKSTQAIRRCLI